MEQRLERGDIRLIFACLAITAVCLAVGTHFFYRAFPEASIDFRVTRDQARDQANAFLLSRGLDPSGYRHSAIFSHDDQAKTFLERQRGLEGATALIGDPVRLWRWSHRWVRQLQKEEFRVEITTSGELVGFEHLVEEEREGGRPGLEEARLLAEQFLHREMGRDLEQLEFVEGQEIERPARTDHAFTWKLRGFAVDEATYRLKVGVQGGRVGSYSEYLKVPETWQRDYGELRSRNQATGLVALTFLALTLLAMLATFFAAVRRQQVRWKTALIFAAIAFALTFLAQLNNLPLTQYRYDTTDTYASFMTQQLVNGLLAALGQGLFIFFLTAAAESIYRNTYGAQMRLGEQFLPHGMRTKRFLLGTIIGLAMTAFFFAYQTLFYVVAGKFGAWSPADIPYSDMVNTYIPWIMVLLIGFMPAVSEEFISRAFSIPFLHRYLKSRWAAVFASALIWGFAHAGYPQQPFYIRGLEVGLAGIAIGFVFLRWGLLAPLVWHYTVDALYTALILLRSSNSYFVASAALSAGLVLLPLVVAAILYWRRRYFVDSSSLLNQVGAPPPGGAQVRPDPDTSPEAQLLRDLPDSPLVRYAPFTRRRAALATALAAASLAVFAAEVEKPLEHVDYAITRDQALQLASAHLDSLGADPSSFSAVAFQQRQADANAVRYALERRDAGWINRLYSEPLQASLWVVRFFRPRDKEEYRVAVAPANGRIYSLRHFLPEEAPGADLSEEQALPIARAHLDRHDLDPDALVLKEASSEKMPARRDHRFVWEAAEDDARNLDEMRYRVEVYIAGERPAGLLRFLKLPENWLRQREQSTALQTTLKGLRAALVVAVLLHLLWLLVGHVRRQDMAWSPLLKVAALAGAVFLLGYLNELAAVERDYPTSISPAVFTIIQIVGAVFGLLGVGLVAGGGLALAGALYPDWQERLRSVPRDLYLRDALLGAALATAAFHSASHLLDLLRMHFAAHLPAPTPSLLSGLDTYLPFVHGLTEALSTGFFLPLIAGIALFYARRILRRPVYCVLSVALLAALFAGADALDWGEFSLGLALLLVGLLCAWLVARFLLRNNLLAYVLSGFLIPALIYAHRLLEQSAPAYSAQAYALSLSAALLIILFWIWFRRLSGPVR